MRDIKTQRISSESGLTLVELLAVIVILGIIAAIAVVAGGSVIQKSRTQAFISNAYAFKESAVYFVKDKELHGNTVPEKITYSELLEAGYLEEVKDPDTGERWPSDNGSYIKVENNKPAAICLIGKKRQLCTDDGPVPFGGLSEGDILE
ncbi:type II secretion system protein [Peribacillus sp. SCS-155]|uniref:type II secretion system protein n=1 Tax=Peribacillus sedimenti TaxID=3115297 RepID=UPI003906C073